VKRSLILLVLLCAGFLQGCSTGAYLWQATTGHLKVLADAQDIDELLARPDTSEKLRAQLKQVKLIRRFSVDALGLPDNASYTRYTALDRPFVVWNVVAAPVDSLELKTWCFPVTGCISYKGFYRESAAFQLADALRLQGLDVAVLGVPAYSTLGFTPDPVLSSFVNYPVGELARLIFHELAHQVVYIADDTTYNESFATAVEELGLEQWLGQPGRETLRAQYEEFDDRRRAFRTLIARAQDDLKQMYAAEPAGSRPELLVAKSLRLQQLNDDYLALKTAWGGWTGYDRFMSEDLNNAKLAVSGLYNAHVPAFKILFQHCGQDYGRFYDAVEVLGQRPKAQRELVLKALPNMARDELLPVCSGDGFDSIVENRAAILENKE